MKVLVLEDQFTSSCPWTTSPCPCPRALNPCPYPWTTKSLKIVET